MFARSPGFALNYDVRGPVPKHDYIRAMRTSSDSDRAFYLKIGDSSPDA